MKKFVPVLLLAVALAIFNFIIQVRLNRNVEIHPAENSSVYRAGPGYEYRPTTGTTEGIAIGTTVDREWVLVSMLLSIEEPDGNDRRTIAWVPSEFVTGNLDGLPVVNNDMRLVDPYAQVTCWASGTTQSTVLGLTIRRGNGQEISFSHPTLREDEDENWGVYEFEIATLPADGFTVYLNGNVLAQIQYDPNDLNVLFDSCHPGS